MKSAATKSYRRLWIAVAVLVILSPLGLLLPKLIGSSGAWGEWGAEGIEEIAGYLPEGIRRLSKIWNSPFPDYTVGAWQEGLKGYAAYILTAVIGVLAVAIVSYLIGRRLSRKNDDNT